MKELSYVCSHSYTRTATELGDEEPDRVLVAVKRAGGEISRRQHALAFDDAGRAKPSVLLGDKIEESDRIYFSRQVLTSH